MPKLIGIYGPPGSGKTFVARTVCKEYEQTSNGGLRFIYVNLGEAKTVFSCANRLLVALGGKWKAGRFGLDGIMEEFWTRVLEWKNEQRRFMLICFDEADKLFMDQRGDPSGFLYRLVRSQDRLMGSGIKLSLITISNTPIWEIWDLDARVRSSMGVEEIFFEPYYWEDLKRILTERCSEAFEPGVVDGKVIFSCYEYTTRLSGDVRLMLDLMRICAEIAEAQGDKKIDMGHYRKAKERMEMDHCQELMDSIALMQRNLLVSLALLDEVEGIASPSTNQVYEKCQEQYGIAPSYRRAAGILKEMELTNLIGVRDVSRGRGGRSNEMWLKIPAHVVLEHAGIDWRRMKELRKAEKETEELRRRLEKRRR